MGTFWLVLCGLFIVIELCTVSFLAFFPAVAAFAAYITALLNFNTAIQCIVFLIGTTLLIIFMKPITDKFIKTSTKPTNVNSVISKTGIVTETIDNLHGKGIVKIDGELWSALADKEDTVIEKDSKIQVLNIKGVKVIVKKI